MKAIFTDGNFTLFEDGTADVSIDLENVNGGIGIAYTKQETRNLYEALKKYFTESEA